MSPTAVSPTAVSPQAVSRDPFDGALTTPPDADEQALLSALPSLHAFYSLDLRLLACTESYARDHGGRPETLRGRRLREVVGAQVYRTCLPHFARAAKGSTEHVSLTTRDAAGGCRRVQLTLVPHFQAERQTSIALLAEDLTVS